MESALTSPAAASIFGIPTVIFAIIIPVVGITIFAYIMYRRALPLVKAEPDERFCCIGQRIGLILKIWLAQWRQPRYMLAGILHILIFAGFIILGARSIQLVILGFSENFVLPGFSGIFGQIYNVLKDYAASWVLIACAIAAVRRGIFKPGRYAVPSRYGKDHTAEAVFVLGLISTLMISESLFEASWVAARFLAGGLAEYASDHLFHP
jgi:hypothetical protein